MKLKTLLIVAATGFFLAGCSNGTPECSDEEATDLVESISTTELAKIIGKEKADAATYTLGAIRTKSTNDKGTVNECAAQLTVRREGTKTDLPITYTIEGADSGDEFYISVYGL